jgi:AcrR family transcriptional regulator
MAAARRIGAPDAKNRGVLLETAEQLMLEEGYVAVTSRRVADKAGLKPQLVHYYFRTMDDLFLAVFRRRAEQGVQVQAQSLITPNVSVTSNARCWRLHCSATASTYRMCRRWCGRSSPLPFRGCW